MHSYSTDSPERKTIPFFIAAAAIAAAFWSSHLLQVRHIEMPWWISPPIDTMAFYGLLYFAYDRYIWRWPIIHRLGISAIPNLSGEWVGEVRSVLPNGTLAGDSFSRKIEIVIQQTWTEMSIQGCTDISKSHSVSASIITNHECSVAYEYSNEPLTGAPDTMHAHRGTTFLSIDSKTRSLVGEYYSGRDRQTIGTITLRGKHRARKHV